MLNVIKMKIDCETCKNDCKGSEKWSCVILHKSIWWTPKNEKLYCIRCHFWHTIGLKCTRHSGPCSLNYLFYKEIQLYSEV